MAKKCQEEPVKLSPAEEDIQEERVRDCRMTLVRKYYKWLNDGLMALRLIKTDKVPTMAVDMHWRCYWNPATVKGWTDAEINGVLIHEVMHLLRRHSRRALPVHELWNVVADMEINDDIKGDNNKDVTLPDKCCLPSDYKLPEGDCAEDYYDHLMKKNVTVVPPPGYGGGSGSDGDKKEWEKDAEGENGNDAVGEEESNIIIQRVAKAIKHCTEPGSLSAGMKRWAEDELEPKVDWRKPLRSVISHSLDMVRGLLFRSFRFPSRRQDELILPGTAQPNPKVAVIIDTSGSMYDELLSQCLAEIKGLLRVVKNGVTYISGDTHTCAKGKTNNVKGVKLEGGGGTDMGRIIEENQKGYDLIIVLTDGYTGWCDKIKPKVVACIVTGDDFNYTAPPSWITTVYVKEPKKRKR